MPDHYENPIRLVRMLKGTPLSVLFALMLSHQPVGETWLIGVTGCSQNPVRRSLNYLAEIGLAQRNARTSGWIATGEAYQLPLFIPSELVTSESHLMTLESTTTALIVDSKLSGQQQQQLLERESFNDARLVTDNLAALHAAGINGKTAITLAHLDHLTPTYIAAHAAYAKARGDSTGLLITRMRDGDPTPCSKPDPDDCHRYVTGPYAYLIHSGQDDDDEDSE